MKSLLFTLALTITTAAFAVCEPNATAGASNDTKTVIAGSETSGYQAVKELNNSKTTVYSDQLGRPMAMESTTTVGATKSIEIVKDDVYSNARVERYCSQTIGLDNAQCVSLCTKWTNYLSRP